MLQWDQTMVEELQFFDRDSIRKNFLKYTRQAFTSIPIIDHPLILDIGCGSGVQTVELARLSNGKITAIDIDRTALAKLRQYSVLLTE
jgi:2-polyprenyl-3-methyl-5-hydroxy-6-metoxy-1,4-benzoquinol methylase